MNLQIVEKKSRKFKELEYYAGPKSYHLLPFRFHQINEQKEIIVNETGDFLIVPNGTVSKIVNHELNYEEDNELYCDLLANFFISEEIVPPLIDVLATKYRTKKSFLDNIIKC